MWTTSPDLAEFAPRLPRMSLTHPDRLEDLEVHHDDPQQHVPETALPQPPAAELVAAGRQASIRPSFTITDAATACAVSRKTITRKLPELAGHGAAKDDDGVWRIPVEALLAVGLRPGRSMPESSPAPSRPVAAPAPAAHNPAPDTITIARDRWDDLRIRLARAEAEASERALALADARLALRALTAGPAATAPREATSLTGSPSAAPMAPIVTAASEPVEAQRTTSAEPPSGPAMNTLSPVPGPSRSGPTPDASAARALAAQTGGHIPAGSTSVKRRRWWQSAR